MADEGSPTPGEKRPSGSADDAHSPEQFRRLVEDLQLHQTELEIQNEELRNTQISLTISQRKYAQYYDLAPVGYFSFDEQGSILELNLLASRMIGKPRGEVRLGQTPFLIFLATRSVAIYRQHLRNVFQSGEVQTCDLVLGSGPTVRLQSCLVELEPTKRVCLSSATDVTEILSVQEKLHASLEQLRESESQFRALLDSINDSVFVHDFEGRFLLVNKAAAANLGLTQDQLMGMPLPGILPPGEVENIQPRIQELMKQGATTFESVHRRSNGELIQVEVKARLVDFRGARVVLSIARDITARKGAEDAIRAAQEAAENANKAKSEFLANMSHEIRTPMNGVIGMTGLLLDSGLTSEQHELAEMIRQSGDSLMIIINDILDLSRIEAGKLSLEPGDFSLPVFLDEIVDLHAVRAQEKEIDILQRTLFGVPHGIYADAGRLRQVLTNLIGNAIKFTATGDIRLTVECLHQDDAGFLLRMTVADSGIGIPAERLSHLFKPFSQIEGTSTRKYGGTGLGLSICKRLVEMMGGEIGVRSGAGQGSEFWFTCRVGKAKGMLPPAFRPTTELSGQKILLCDRREARRSWLSEILQKWGLEVLEETSVDRVCEAVQMNDRRAIRHVLFHHEDVESTRRVVEAIRNCPVAPAPNLVIKSSLRNPIKKTEFDQWGLGPGVACPVHQSALWDALAHPQSQTVKRHDVGTPRAASIEELVPSLRGRTVRVLLVEDNPMNQRVMTRLLKCDSLRVDIAANGIEAVKALELLPYDLVLMDMQMPEMDGYEATRIIRDPASGVRSHTVPIIAITASAMSQDRERCLAAGVNSYLAKPIQRLQLFAAIESCLKGSVEGTVPSPAARGAPAVVPSTAPVPKSWMIRVLVVDDNKISLKVAQVLLGRRTQTVHLALNGAEALQLIEREAYDLVFLDLHLPDFDGNEVARMIREAERRLERKGAAIFALSASDRPEDIKACTDSGMDGFLVKPLSPQEIERLFGRLFPDR